MDKSLFRYVWRHTKREQFYILLTVLCAQAFYFVSLNVPKTIVNEAIQGRSFPRDSAGKFIADATVHFLTIHIPVPHFISASGMLDVFDGLVLERVPYLVVLSLVFLTMVMINGGFKLRINTEKGRMGERMLRRLRYELFDRVLRFPQSHFRKVKQAELATMIKDEVEPLGGFIGDAFVQPVFLGGQALTALFFILTQSFWLGMVAVSVLALQIVIIPRLRRRVLVLGKMRQLTARQLAGRIAEGVDGSADIHVNATSNYERADIVSRLGRIFHIRFDLYQRKFTVKFLNNLLAQTTPFLFYLIGGYLAIKGHLDIGGLVAVIAAYKDLPPPIKELIDWDQQRQDVQIKYEQVIEQFSPDGMVPPELQAPPTGPIPPLQGPIAVNTLTVIDDAGVRTLDSASFSLDIHRHVALVGPPSGGKEALALALARLAQPVTGTITIGGQDLATLPEAVTGARMSYLGQEVYLFPVSVRDNVVYGLKRVEMAPAHYNEEERRAYEYEFMETRRAGNPTYDPNAEWIDYASAGATGPDDLDERILEVLEAVELADDVYQLGLRGTIDPDQRPDIAASIMKAREELHQRLDAPQLAALVEPFNRNSYVSNMSVAENLLFGTAVDPAFAPENLAQNALVLQVLDRQGLTPDLVSMGRQIAETMLELFADLPAGHPFFEQFSFIAAEDLPEFRVILPRVQKASYDAISPGDRERLLALVFPYIEARHRLGLIDAAMEERLLAARRVLAETLPQEAAGGIEFYDRTRYNRAATLQDNILFGRMAYGQAQAGERIGRLIAEVLDTLQMRRTVVQVGLDFNVGNAGKRLTAAQRQKVGMARALLKRPDLLIVNEGLAVLDAAGQMRLLDRVLTMRRGQGVLWVLSRGGMAASFDDVLVLREGKVAAQGKFAELNKPDTPVGALLAAE